MKILFIGNANLKFAARSHFIYNTRILNGLIRNEHYVYFFSDRDEVRTASPFGLKAIGKNRANQKLLTIAREFQPDAIVMAHVNLIEEDTLRQVKNELPGVKIARINVDAVFTPHNSENLKKYADVVDATFITTGGPALSRFASPTQPFYFIPNITDTSIDTGRAFDQEAPLYDLSCFMHNDNAWDEQERRSMANGITRALPQLKTCYRGFNGAPSIRGDEYLTALQNSAMALNLSRTIVDGMESTSETRYLYSSDRLAHIMGNGALAFSSDQYGLQDLYTADEMIFFSGQDDLIDKVHFYKNNPKERQRIAHNGWLKAHQEFNEVTIIQYVLERLFEKELSRDYAWPIMAWY